MATSEKLSIDESYIVPTDEDKKVKDAVTKLIGGFGRYQLRAVFLCSLVSAFTGWHMMVISFMAPGIDHWCAPTDGYQNFTVTEWKELAIPKDEHVSRCKSYLFYLIYRLLVAIRAVISTEFYVFYGILRRNSRPL